MRRKDRAVVDKEAILAIMERCRVCSVAFSGGEFPYVLPLNFGVGEKDGVITLYFHGAGEGMKFERLRADNRAAFSMYAREELVLREPACGTTMLYESVCGTGRLFEVVSPQEKAEALGLIMQQYDRKNTKFDFEAGTVEKTAVLRLEVETVTGKTNRKS